MGHFAAKFRFDHALGLKLKLMVLPGIRPRRFARYPAWQDLTEPGHLKLGKASKWMRMTKDIDVRRKKGQKTIDIQQTTNICETPKDLKNGSD